MRCRSLQTGSRVNLGLVAPRGGGLVLGLVNWLITIRFLKSVESLSTGAVVVAMLNSYIKAIKTETLL